MAKQVITDLNLNEQEIQNVSLEKLATDPSGAGLYKGRVWHNSTTDLVKRYDGVAVQILADRSYVTSEINKLERLQGAFSAAPGLLPTASNKTQGDLTQVIPGDYWIISTGGTIVGIQGDDTLSTGDKLQYVGGGAATAANWVGIQTNLNDSLIGNVTGEKQTVSLTANTPLAVNAATITNIHSIQIYTSAGDEIIIDIQKLGGANQRTITSKKTLTGVVVELLGTK